jgi:hypothetical protein
VHAKRTIGAHKTREPDIKGMSSEKKEKQKNIEPYERLLFSIKRFLADIECTQDMFSMVVPALEEQDGKTKDEIDKILSIIKRNIKAAISKNPSEMIRHIRTLVHNIYSLNRANVMFRSHALVCLISQYDYFLSELLKNAYRKNPERATGSDRTLTYEELLSLDSLDNLVELFITKDLDGFLREAHDKQLTVIDREFKLGIIDNFAEYPYFVEMTERRNLFVHGGGVVTKFYLKRCTDVGYAIGKDVKVGTALNVSQEYFDKTVMCLFELGFRLGFALACRLYPDRLNEIHNVILADIGFPLLMVERWEIARRLFAFALSWPDKFVPNDEIRRYHVVNTALALNHLGRHEEALSLLSNYDWSSQSDKLLLAVSIIRRKWTEAERIMSNMDGNKPFSEDDYRTWPIFKEFRSTKEFRNAYTKLYGKRYVARLTKTDTEQIQKLSKKRIEETA